MRKLFLIFSVLVLLLINVYLICFHISTSTKALSENSDILDNPSRGLYIQVDSSNIYAFEYLENDTRLILLAYNLEDYTDCEISEDKLSELEAFLSLGEEYGVKFIFRAAYGFTSDAYYNDIDDMELLETHILQIAPILNEYKNVIHCVQAGFMGPWGEWHSSLLLEDLSDDDQISVRNDIVNLLLTNIDSSLPIALRRPSFIVNFADAGYDTSRLCIYNDGLFGSESDLGTYDKERSEAISEWNSIIGASTNGGEMPYVSDWTLPELVDAEMYQMKISYLNAYYNTEVLDTWDADTIYGENALKYITNHLGYRFYISEITTIEHIPYYFLFNNIPITFTISNSGYSEIEDSYIGEVIIQSAGTILETIEISSFEGVSIDSPLTVTTSLQLDSDIVENGLSIGLKIYDSENPENPLFYVKLANDEAEYINGINWFNIL